MGRLFHTRTPFLDCDLRKILCVLRRQRRGFVKQDLLEEGNNLGINNMKSLTVGSDATRAEAGLERMTRRRSSEASMYPQRQPRVYIILLPNRSSSISTARHGYGFWGRE